MEVAEERRTSADRRQDDLGWLPLFAAADRGALAAAIGDSPVTHLGAGDTLLNPGDGNDTVFIVLSGELGVHLADGATNDDAIRILPGECLGELSAIDGKPVSALVRATTDVRVLELSQEVFWHRLMAVPGVARNLLVFLAARMRRSVDALLEGQRQKLLLDQLRQEMDVARQLQTGMLPMGRPLFPDRRDIAVAGTMEAAATIGGDLFDAMFVEPHRLFFCIGDVSGHGIPAAMFMARTVSLLRAAAMTQRRPATVLGRVNLELSTGNDANMFVTLLCGFLDLETGRLVYSNGGHLPPLLLKDGVATALPLPKGTALGIMPGLEYRQSEVMLANGECICCFTDGVTEAQSPAGEEYGEDRLAKLLAGADETATTRELEALLSRVRNDVMHFTARAELDDDLTLLAFGRRDTAN